MVTKTQHLVDPEPAHSDLSILERLRDLRAFIKIALLLLVVQQQLLLRFHSVHSDLS
jgi:hypothetical protein